VILSRPSQVGVEPLLPLVDEAADGGWSTAAASLARALLLAAPHASLAGASCIVPEGGAAFAAGHAFLACCRPAAAAVTTDDDVDVAGDAHASDAALVAARFRFGGIHDLALGCFERGAVADGAEILGGSPPLQLAALQTMLSTRRCLGLAAQYLPALSLVPMPSPPSLTELGSQACALLAAAPQGAARAEAARARVEEALRATWPSAVVRVYGSAALGLSVRTSDVDLCALIPPQTANAHPASPTGIEPPAERVCAEGAHNDHIDPSDRHVHTGGDVHTGAGHGDAPTPLSHTGRNALAPMLERAASALTRALGGSLPGAVRQLPHARTPQLTFHLHGEGPDASPAVRVDLTLNNVSGLANTYIAGALLARAPVLRPASAAMRAWARSKGLCGGDGVLSSYAWLLMTAHVLQYRGGLPPVDARCAPFEALLQAGVVAEGPWRAAAAEAVSSGTAAAPSSPGMLSLGTAFGGAGLQSPSETEPAAQEGGESTLSETSGDKRGGHLAAVEEGGESMGVEMPAVATQEHLCAVSATSPAVPVHAAPAGGEAEGRLSLAAGELIWHCLRHWAFAFPYRKLIVSLRDPTLTKQRKGCAGFCSCPQLDPNARGPKLSRFAPSALFFSWRWQQTQPGMASTLAAGAVHLRLSPPPAHST
jgi:hypothetical protein